MKNKIILLFIICLGLSVQAQQLRFVDTGYILAQIPQYDQAKQRLEQQVDAWKSEISSDEEEISNLESSLENERVILTDEKIAEKESVIDTKKEKLNQKIEQKFGINGESQQLRVNLVKPLQDQIWNAINAVAQKNGYHMIFDKSTGSNLIYADAKYDITDMVIKEMGLDKQPKNTQPKSQPRGNEIKGKNQIDSNVEPVEEMPVKKRDSK